MLNNHQSASWIEAGLGDGLHCLSVAYITEELSQQTLVTFLIL